MKKYNPTMYIDIADLPMLSVDLASTGLLRKEDCNTNTIDISADDYLDELQAMLGINYQIDFAKVVGKDNRTVLVCGSTSPYWVLFWDVIATTIA